MKPIRILSIVFTIVAADASLAQNPSINWYKVAGGGGTSTGGVYSVNGTIGQHDAGGPMSGGTFSLHSGFWSQFAVTLTPGAPPLYITHSGGTVTVFWQNVGNWRLEQNASAAAPAGWTDSIGVTIANGTNHLSIPNPAGSRFFRLH